MDDLIRREDAFSYFVTLWECIGTIMDRDEWEDVCMTTANEIPSAQPEQRWIPVSKPPEEDGTYLVYAPYYTGVSSSAKEWHDGVMFSKYKNGKWSIEHGYHKRPNCVKAYMPLPEPYKGENECI